MLEQEFVLVSLNFQVLKTDSDSLTFCLSLAVANAAAFEEKKTRGSLNVKESCYFKTQQMLENHMDAR